MESMRTCLIALLWFSAAILWPISVSDPNTYSMVLALAPWTLLSLALCVKQQFGIIYLQWFCLSFLLLFIVLILILISGFIPYYTYFLWRFISGIFTSISMFFLLSLTWSRLVRIQRILLGALSVAALPFTYFILALQFPLDHTDGPLGSGHNWFSFASAATVTYLTSGFQVLFHRDMLVPKSGAGQSMASEERGDPATPSHEP